MSYDIDLVTKTIDGVGLVVLDRNITSNLREMMVAAGLPDSLHSLNGKTGAETSDLLTNAVDSLRSDPEKFERYNSPNGWGLYKNLVPFLDDLRSAAVEHPSAIWKLYA